MKTHKEIRMKVPILTKIIVLGVLTSLILTIFSNTTVRLTNQYSYSQQKLSQTRRILPNSTYWSNSTYMKK